MNNTEKGITLILVVFAVLLMLSVLRQGQDSEEFSSRINFLETRLDAHESAELTKSPVMLQIDECINEYNIAVMCDNCAEVFELSIPKGTSASSYRTRLKCPKCGVRVEFDGSKCTSKDRTAYPISKETK